MPDHENVLAYAAAHTTSRPPILDELTAITEETTTSPGMQSGVAESILLTTVTHIMQPRFVVEVGTFTGASAIAIARALPDGGRILCCDVSEEWTAIARDFWSRAGIDDRIELRIGPASETLTSLPHDEPIDLAFIDADKPGYIDYYEAIVARLAPHGLIAVDNVLWDLKVLDDRVDDPDTQAIRAFNAHVVADERVEVVVLPVGDGVSLITRTT